MAVHKNTPNVTYCNPNPNTKGLVRHTIMGCISVQYIVNNEVF